MNTLRNDITYALRMLRKSPGFTFVAILTLALGIGANTAIFSVVYVSLLRPLPYSHPEQLVALGEGRTADENANDAANSSYPDYQDWKHMAKSFQSLTAYGFDAFTFSGNGDPKNVFAMQISPNFLSTLGVKPILGRDFVEGEDQPDGPHVAILSYANWQSEFGADPHVIGRSYRLDDKTATIVGVLPREFEFAPAGISSGLWVPMHAQGDTATRRSLRWLNVIARVAPGVSAKQVRAEMVAITAQLAREYPVQDAAVHVGIKGLREKIVGQIRPLLLILLGTVALVLLIACANLANLLLARSIGRQKEFAIRAALGATRMDLVRQMLTESALLSFLGAAAGILIAQWGVSALISAIPDAQLQTMPYLRDASTNLPVLLFLVAVTALTGLIFGLAPGFAIARTPVGKILKDESRGATSSTHAGLRNAFVAAEIAICLVLLVGAGLMLRSFQALVHRNPGFDMNNVLTFSVNLPDATYPQQQSYPYDSPKAIQFAHQFKDRLRATPGVESVGMSSGIPLSNNGGTIRFVIEGHPVPSGTEDECQIRTVDSGYFPALKIPLIGGRLFNDAADAAHAPGTAIVNQAWAKRYLPGENAVGKRVRFTFSSKNQFLEIVGVAGDIAETDLADTFSPVIYVPNDQTPNTFLSLLVRTKGDPAAFVGASRAALHEMDPQLALIAPESLEQIVGESQGVFLRRYPSYLIGAFAGLALILAITGLHGLISYSVMQRTREIGIRVALGAQPRDILQLVLRRGLPAVFVGVGIGIVAAFALTRLMSSLLYGVTPNDAITFVSVACLLTLVAVVACLMPARRAMRVDPMVALRYE
jgi:putative ABC transport system permease protein